MNRHEIAINIVILILMIAVMGSCAYFVDSVNYANAAPVVLP